MTTASGYSGILAAGLAIAGLAVAPHAHGEVGALTADNGAAAAAPEQDGDIGALRTRSAGLGQSGQDAEAIASWKQTVALTEERFGADAPELAKALLPLADLQLDNGDFGGAIGALERAVGVIEQHEGVFSPGLVDPLAALSRAYRRLGRAEDAVTVLRRARHVTHRQRGILNMEQLELSDELAEAYMNLGKVDEANRENRFAYRVNVRRYGEDSVEMVPAITKLAGWYERVGHHTAARRHYKRAVELIETRHGPNDLRIVAPLTKIARTYRSQGMQLRDGEAALDRAIDVFAAHPEADVVEHARSLIELGDWFMLSRRREKAIANYRKAWNLLTSDGASPQQGELLLGKPERLEFKPPIPDPSLFVGQREFFIDVAFSVSSEGQVRNLAVTNASAHWRIQRDFRSAMRYARFRPRFVDGDPVETSDLHYRWSFEVPDQPPRAEVVPVSQPGPQ